MILSERHNFIFIKGMKVAGTSVEIALSRLCGPDDIVTPVSAIDERLRLSLGARCQNYAATRAAEDDYLAGLKAARTEDLADLPPPPRGYYNHMPLAAVAMRYGKPISGFRIVCIERSPYAKVISWANMQRSYNAYQAGGAMRADVSVLQNAVDRGFETGAIREPRNIDRYRNLEGKVAAEIMRYETLQADYDSFVRSLGVEDVPPLPHAKKGLLSDTLAPAEFFRPDQIAKINTLFADEFAAFGYTAI